MPARFAFLSPFETANLVDEFDEIYLGQVSNPSSDILKTQVAAYNRIVDATIIIAATGSATTSTNTGITGIPTTTALAYDYVNQAVRHDRIGFGATAAASGLTIDKIRYAKFKMDRAEAPAEDRILVISAAEIQDLLSTTEVTNSLFNSVKALVDGDVDSFLGFKVVRTELLGVNTYTKASAASDPTVSGVTVTASTAGTAATGIYSNAMRTCFAYHKNSVVLVDGGRKSYMDVLPTVSHNLQIRSTAVLGATRLLDSAVVQIITDTTKQ